MNESLEEIFEKVIKEGEKMEIKINPFVGFLWTIFNIATAMIGYTIHGSIFWSIVDFFFAIFAWIKWLILHQVSMSVIKETFAFFLN